MNCKTLYIALLTVCFGLASCNKLLDINPKQSIDSSTALSSQDGIQAALISAYSRLQSYKYYGRDYLAVAEALSDNVVHTGNSAVLSNEAANNRNYHLDGWQTIYYAINEINLVLEAVDRGDYDEDWSASVNGQAHFLRALFYHDLARSYAYDPTANIPEYDYGSVPLMLVGVDDVSKIQSLVRSEHEAVYDQIYDDLEKAYAFLSAGSGTSGPHRVTKSAVSALHSRVALYRGDFPTVIMMADRALQETTAVFSTNANFLSDWSEEVHPESIFEIKFNISENLGADRSLRSMYTSRATYDATTFSIQAVLAASPILYQLHEPGDVREGLYRFGVGNNTAHREIYKFISKNGTLNLDNVPVLRITELYLNRAEAYQQMGGATEHLALDDLNRIRNRAGLSSITNLSGEALLAEILHQRRLELAFEGHRWFDLKRHGKDVVKTPETIVFNDYRILPPIPEREVLASEGELKQNYNY